MAIYEGRWDCKYCRHKGVAGPNVHCTQCGAPRAEDVLFYLPKDAGIVTDEDVLKKAQAGPNWNCSNCDSNNEHWNTFCGNCGSPFRAQDKDTILKERSYKTGEVPDSADTKTKPIEVKRRSKLSTTKKKAGLWALFTGMIFTVLSMFNSAIQVDVTGHEWTRTIEIQQYRQVQEAGWRVPSDGKEIKRFQDVHHYDRQFEGYQTRTRMIKEKVGEKQYVCGKNDLGNGYFEDKYCTRGIYRHREEQYQEKVYKRIPVYATRYHYLIYRWKADDPLITRGNNHQPKWGNKIGLDNPRRFRIINKKAEYWLQIKDHKKELHREDFPLQQWQQINVGDKLPALKSTVYGYYKDLDREKIKGLYQSSLKK